MIEDALSPYDSLIKRFSSSQFEAFNCDGHCVVLAGPGSGKTSVLVARAARLLAQRALGPRGVACVTYSEETARELKNRLVELGVSPSSRLFVGTVHSFCLSCIVTPFGHLFHPYIKTGMALAGSKQQELALGEALKVIRLGGTASQWKSRLEYFRRTHPVREKEWRLGDPKLALLTEIYEGALSTKGLFDFDDLVRFALDLIRRHGFVRSALEARFPFLVIDEYQDLGYPLHLIVRNLMKNTSIEVFAVGDPDQSIYGFAGAKPKFLRELACNSSVHTIDLRMNYRSTQLIIDSSQLVLAPQEPRMLKSGREDEKGGIFFIQCNEGIRQQAEHIAFNLIPSLRRMGIPYDQIAILYLDKSDSPALRLALEEAGINFSDERRHRYPKTPFTRWLEEVAAWCALFPGNTQLSSLDELFIFYSKMCNEAGISHETTSLASYSSFFENLKSIAKPNLPMLAWLTSLDKGLDLSSVLDARREFSDDSTDWHAILQSCSGGGPLADSRIGDFAHTRGRPDSVTLTTLHSSKGREFRVVVLPGLEDGRFPRHWAKTDEELAESRRVLYVGMTRAKDSIYMLYSGWYKSGRGQVFRKGLSRFVCKLHAELSE